MNVEITGELGQATGGQAVSPKNNTDPDDVRGGILEAHAPRAASETGAVGLNLAVANARRALSKTELITPSSRLISVQNDGR